MNKMSSFYQTKEESRLLKELINQLYEKDKIKDDIIKTLKQYIQLLEKEIDYLKQENE